MRKIRSAEEVERREKLIRFVVGGVLIALMVFSTAGFALFSGGGSSNNNVQKQEDNYFNGRHWVYNVQGQEFYFTNPVELVENISVNIEHGFDLEAYRGSNVYIDVENDNQVILNEIGINLGRYVSHIQQGCYGPCEEDLPEKNCTEANLIIWEESENNEVYQEDRCVFIEGDLVAVDAFLYRFLGIN